MNRKIRLILFSIFIIAFCFGLTRYFIGNPNKYDLVYSDWRLHLSWAGVARNSILRYGQLPLWNPYRCGGVPILGEPESDIFSPYLLFLIIFGPLIGYLVYFIVNFFVGCIGFYKLGRHYGLSSMASVLVGQTYMMSGLYIIPFFVGMTNFIAIGYLPFVILYYERYLDSGVFKNAIGAAFFASLMFLSGFHYIPIVLLYFVVSAIIRALQVSKLQEFIKCIFVGAIFIGFSAIKLFRSLDLVLHHGPVTYNYEQTGGYSLTSLWHSLVSRDQTSSMINRLTTPHTNFWTGTSYQIDENGMYIGVILFVLFVYGYFKRTKAYSRLLYIFFLFIIISFGTNIYPSLYSLLKTLPVISSIRVATRFRYIFMIPVVLLIGYGYDKFMRYVSDTFKIRPIAKFVLSCIFLLVVGADLIYVNFNPQNVSPMIRNIKTITPNRLNSFYNRCDLELSEYEIIMQNQGNLNCLDNVLFPINATCKEDDDYKGRAHLLKEQGATTLTYFSPNRLRVHATVSNPDTLVINQNFSRYWRATVDGKHIKVINTNDVVGVPLPKGEHRVEIYYSATWIFTGASVTLLSFLFFGICFYKNRKQ